MHPDVCLDPLPPSFRDAHVAKRHKGLAGVGENTCTFAMTFKTVSSVADHADGGAHAAVRASADSVLLLASAAVCMAPCLMSF